MLIVCPELTERKYPGAEWYQEGGIMDADGHIREKEERTFSAADRIVAEVKTARRQQGKSFFSAILQAGSLSIDGRSSEERKTWM